MTERLTREEFIAHLLSLPNAADQEAYLRANVPLLDSQVANALKEQANNYLWSNIRRSQETAGLILILADLTGDPLDRALGLLAQANAHCIGLAEYQAAIERYDEAAAIYAIQDRPVEQARSQVGKINALTNLGQYQEALAAGQWASQILEEHGQREVLADVILNLGTVLSRAGDEAGSLKNFERAARLYDELGAEGQEGWLVAQQNRAVALRVLGRFEEAIEASHIAMEGMEQQGRKVEAARVRQNLALTYFLLGRYNEALAQLDQVREVFLADNRQRDAILVDLFTSDCLLQLRRFDEVLKKSQRARGQFTNLGIRDRAGQSIVNEAVAFAELGRYAEAAGSLAEARQVFEAEDNMMWVASTDMELAAVIQRQERHDESLALALKCASMFASLGLPIEEARASLMAAKAAAALGREDEALGLAGQALEAAEEHNLPALKSQGQHVLGRLAAARGDLPAALAAYDQAIEEMEKLRGRLMVEFRVGFVEDKQVLYEDAVAVCLALDRADQSLAYAERAKSRTLLDLVAHRLDVSILARTEADRPLIDEIVRLRAKRDLLCRRWESDHESGERGWSSTEVGRRQAQREVLSLEQRITDLWHRLLIRNADYAREASMWTVHTEPAQPYLEPDTLLVEYFAVHGSLVAFLASDQRVVAHPLDCDLATVQKLMQLLWLNLRMVSQSGPEALPGLTSNALGLLQQLHECVLAPLTDVLTEYRRLIIVPHGLLHYIPFHALHDGDVYLLERFEISYLPGASFLRYCREAVVADAGLLAVGHSSGGKLPHAVHEAQSVAALLNGEAIVEEQARLEALGPMMGQCRTVHLAAHGDFRPDNPLFSGLRLSGGWLTTLDIFGLRLQASLVTLSACQTGRSVVGGGDELLGLMRAFLCAGAASLVLSLWAVEDRSTEQLMVSFYERLAAGQTKEAALREAQLKLLRGDHGDRPVPTAHPYYWAPFFLVGAAGQL